MNRRVFDSEESSRAGRKRFAWEEAASPAPPAGEGTSPSSGRSVFECGVTIRGEGALRRLESGFAWFDRLVAKTLPEHLNPLARTGAIANTCLLIATVSGMLLLFWYSPSVNQAYESLRESSPLGQFMRSLHRYSSDACILFVLIHAVRVFVGLKFTGARSLAWVTGIVLIGLIWIIGWTGYWLVWDERAQQVALGTARFFSVVPVFGEPLARSFLTNEGVPSLLFFLIFFVHMLLPLAIGVMLWLHLSRLSRPKLLTGRWLTVWIVGTLAVLSLAMPAVSAEPADLSAHPEGFGMDWWYLWPLVLTDRLSGGMLWAVLFVGTLGLCALPRLMVRRGKAPEMPARVDEDACQGCTLCSKDCPFDAIRMVGRESGAGTPRLLSVVDPGKCVACGICTGACDSDAIALPGFEVPEEKRSLSRWVRRRREAGEPAFLAYGCGRTAGSWKIDPATGETPVLPGYRFRSVPCAGWVSATLIEYAIQEGAEGVLVIGCGSHDKRYREGAEWLEQRLDGRRKPFLRPRRADPGRVLFMQAGDGRNESVIRVASEFRQRLRKPARRQAGRVAAVASGAVLAVVLAAATWLGSDAFYRAPAVNPELIVSFNHSGERVGEQQRLSPEELERRPVHMRANFGDSRERAPVRLRVSVDGETVLEETYRPRGLRRDGPSTALETISLPEGTREVRVQVNDTADPGAWPHEWTEEVSFAPRDRRVLTFESERGFRWH